MTEQIITTRRVPYGARSQFPVWPDGARMAVLVYTAPEEWNWAEREPLPPPGTFAVPGEPRFSLSTRSAVAYGYNVGLHRLAEIFEKHDMQVTLWTNGVTVEQHRQVLDDLVAAGHELGAHGYSEGVPLSTLGLDEQRESITRTVELLGEVAGTRPRGWIGPGAACTADTVRLLIEEGFDYHCDLQDDEIPYFVSAGDAELIEIPYRMVGNVNDFPIFTRNVQSVKSGVQHLKEAFDAYHAVAQATPLQFNYGTHPYVSGRPDYSQVLDEFLGYVHSFDDVWVCNYAQIADWWQQHRESDELVTDSIRVG